MIAPLSSEALVVGGGPAGSALAIALAEAGLSVVLVEKSKEAQHKVCGEFLSPESLPLLHQLGISPDHLGAQTIHSTRLVTREVLAEVRFPAPAFSLTRRALDEALLQRAQQVGVNVHRGWTAERLDYLEGSNRWQAHVSDDGELAVIEGESAFLATGKHGLRGWARVTKGTHNNLVAFKMYFALSSEQQKQLAGYVELILFPGGYAGLQMVGGGCANLCAVVTREKLQQPGAGWDSLLDYMLRHSDHLARRLNGSIPTLERPLALSAIPYGYCMNGPIEILSPWRIGDQAAVIPSFSGDGMAIALYTARRAAQLYLGGYAAADFHREIRKQFQRSLYCGSLLSRLVTALPSLGQVARIWPSVLLGIFSATRVPDTAPVS